MITKRECVTFNKLKKFQDFNLKNSLSCYQKPSLTTLNTNSSGLNQQFNIRHIKKLRRTTNRIPRQTFSQNKQKLKQIKYIRTHSTQNLRQPKSSDSLKQSKIKEKQQNQYNIYQNSENKTNFKQYAIKCSIQKNNLLQNSSLFEYELNFLKNNNLKTKKQNKHPYIVQKFINSYNNNQAEDRELNDIINTSRVSSLRKILCQQRNDNINLKNQLNQYQKKLRQLTKILEEKQSDINKKDQEIKILNNRLSQNDKQNHYFIKISNQKKEPVRRLTHCRNLSDPQHLIRPNNQQSSPLILPEPTRMTTFAHKSIASMFKSAPEQGCKVQSSSLLLDSVDQSNIRKFVNRHLKKETQDQNERQLSGLMLNVNDISSFQGDENSTKQNQKAIKLLQEQIRYKDIEICMLKKKRDQQRKQFSVKQKLLKMLMGELKEIKARLIDHPSGKLQTTLREQESEITLQFSLQ